MLKASLELRLVAMLVFAALMAACTHYTAVDSTQGSQCRSSPDLTKEEERPVCCYPPQGGGRHFWCPVCCDSSQNIAVCYFANADIQSGDGSVEPIRDAIKDAISLSLEELRIKRYPDYQLKPNQWTFEQTIERYTVPNSRTLKGMQIDPETKGFLEAVKQPEALATLKKFLDELERTACQYESED